MLIPINVFRKVTMATKPKKDWIQGAIKRPGAFTAKAKKAGKSVAGMAAAVSKNPGKYSPRTVKQANLAKTLRKINKGK